MGLAGRRAAKEFETEVYPSLKKQIDEAAGFDVPVEVNWETLTKEESYMNAWKDSWPKIYFQPIVDSFKSICADAMGKDALKAALKKVVVQDAKPSYSSEFASLDGGTLTIDYQFCNVDDVATRTKTLTTLLESKL